MNQFRRKPIATHLRPVPAGPEDSDERIIARVEAHRSLEEEITEVREVYPMETRAQQWVRMPARVMASLLRLAADFIETEAS